MKGCWLNFFKLCDCSFGKRAAARPALAGLPHKKKKKKKKNPCLPTAQPSLRLRSLHQSRRGNICPLSHSSPPPHFSDGPHGGNDGDGTNAAQMTSEEEGNHLLLLYFHFPFFLEKFQSNNGDGTKERKNDFSQRGKEGKKSLHSLSLRFPSQPQCLHETWRCTHVH